jgi:acetoin:2,6-dichlorophenolindophenol oxidoreductase subunit beta
MTRFALPSDLEPITYADAIRISIGHSMEVNPKIVVYGLGVDDPTAMYGTTKDYPEIFGSNRCFDTSLSEDSMTGLGIGLSINGYRPIHVHQRSDFLLLCANQLINIAAKIKYVSNGRMSAPLIVRAIVGRSWGQGCQHSQSFHSLFANIPGMRVFAPATSQDVFNVYANILKSNFPAVIFEHRMLYNLSSRINLTNTLPNVTCLSDGDDITICSVSHMTYEAQRASEYLNSMGYSCAHYGIVDITKTDISGILRSAMKTNKLLIIDHGWLNCSIAHTIGYQVYEQGFKGRSKCLGYKDSPCPTSRVLEDVFYPDAQLIANECLAMLGRQPVISIHKSQLITSFKGPF